MLYAEGCRITEPGNWYLDPVVLPDPEEDKKRIEEAVEIARETDIVILLLGGNELTSREAWGRVPTWGIVQTWSLSATRTNWPGEFSSWANLSWWPCSTESLCR